MARETYVLRNGELVPKHLAAPREGGSSPYVISDGMDPIRSQADGRMYDSKSAYARAVKAAGAEIIGSDPVPRRPPEMPSMRADLRQAIQQLRG